MLKFVCLLEFNFDKRNLYSTICRLHCLVAVKNVKTTKVDALVKNKAVFFLLLNFHS